MHRHRTWLAAAAALCGLAVPAAAHDHQPRSLMPPTHFNKPAAGPEAVPCPELCPEARACGGGWYIMGDTLFLKRETYSDRVLAVFNGGTANDPIDDLPRLRASDLDFDWTMGPRITLGKQVNERYGLQFTYFYLHTVANVDAYSDAGNLDVPFDADVSDSFDGANALRFSYTTNLHSFEANSGFSTGGAATLLVGFRYLYLNEKLHLWSYDEGVNELGLYQVDTENHLIGFQTGVNVNVPVGCRFHVAGQLKGGLYVNFANQRQAIDDDFGTATVERFRDERDNREKFAFVGEASLVGHYRLNERVSLRGGYQLLWLNGVALATHQVDLTTDPGAGTNIRTAGNAFYHGALFGVEFRW